MVVMLSALRTGRTLLPRNIIFLLQNDWTPGPSAAWRIRKVEKFPSSCLEHKTFRHSASVLTTTLTSAHNNIIININ
jgi:hypothetical protein